MSSLYTISRRRRELGVRTALGASRSNIVWLVCRDGMLVAGFSVVIGLPAAAALARLMRGMLFGIDAGDVVSLPPHHSCFWWWRSPPV